MADLAAIRQRLADVCNHPTSGLGDHPHVHPRVPDSIQPPTAIVEPDNIDWRTAMGRGHEAWTFHLLVLLATTSMPDAERRRDAYFGGVNDVKGVIEAADPDGAWMDLFVASADQFDAYQVAGETYVGVRFTVEVIA